MEPTALGLPASVGPIEVRRTHLSEVFLTADRVYKVKRAVNLGFVDFTDRAARLRACEAEVALNRRLAPDVYLGLHTLPDGEPAVVMRRLDDADAMLAHLERGALDVDTVRRVARRIAAFHAAAETGPEIAGYGRFDVVRQNALDNFDQSAEAVGVAVSAVVHARARAATERALDGAADAIEARAGSGRVRDTHGDLRLEHVYLPDGEVVVIDCIEFADRFRYADVAADIGFLTMDLEVRSRRDLADVAFDAWADAARDPGARALRPLYTSYRSAVRAKVAGMTLADPTASADRRASQLARARRHWMLAWSAVEDPARRPVLVGIGGLPGTGKSTVARGLGDAGFAVVRSDVVRKEALGIAPTARAADAAYTDDARDAVYDRCFDRAAGLLFAGERVVIDASFTADRWRAG
ncbi:MAG: AAA family ATPase, partial [Myxococcota bacterium]